MRHPPKTTPKAIQMADVVASTLERRAAGVPVSEIAREDGVTESAVYQRLRRAIATTREEPAAELVALELHRLDEMQRALWAAATLEPFDPGPLAGGIDTKLYAQQVSSAAKATEAILRIMKRRAELLGLDHAEMRETALARQDITGRQAQNVVGALHRIFARLNLSEEQRAMLSTVVPQEMRRLSDDVPDVVQGDVEDDDEQD